MALITPRELRLYLVLDPNLCGGLEGMIETTRIAVQNGVTLVQLRAPEWKKRQWMEAARRLKSLLAPTGVKLIINDQVDVALAIDADGVHVGQSDMAPQDVRRLLGPEKIIGLSISSLEECRPEDLACVDYLGIGPIWPTSSKPDAAPALGLDGLRAVVDQTKMPNVAIGGIKSHNIQACLEHGADGIAIISAICGQKDVAQATKTLLSYL